MVTQLVIHVDGLPAHDTPVADAELQEEGSGRR